REPSLKILIGHGSGSFGHHAARKFDTRQGVSTPEDWQGFQEVWVSAHKLNQIVISLATKARLPVISFPPSAATFTTNHIVQYWELTPMRSVLAHGLIPLVYGDVVVDTALGGTILSTEDLFVYLAKQLHPARILLAGSEEGVFTDFPANTHLIPVINRDEDLSGILKGSASQDVTGGMLTKVNLMQALCCELPGLEVRIFNAEDPTNLSKAMQGKAVGTLIR
ncbi:MAG TPA: isopentenyl phosphate kinase, partial [Anaerolineaceae bacterium]|nr:isopentenyl phosphate kinase [Anaerolineaceae bacterium]